MAEELKQKSLIGGLILLAMMGLSNLPAAHLSYR
jgi:hypothetical protein